MTDIRSLAKNNTILPPVVISDFEIIEDKISGFGVRLRWNYAAKVVAFKVFKSTLNKPILSKNYEISQRALEATTPNLTQTATNTVLYNKNFYSQNSKVSIGSTTGNHNKKESPLNTPKFQEISILKKDDNVDSYEFLDKNVKFGESYMYHVVAFDSWFNQTKISPIVANVEVFWPPPPPESVTFQDVNQGILLLINAKKTHFIEAYKIFRRDLLTQVTFDEIATVKTRDGACFYVDLNVKKNVSYEYRIFSVDIYGNISNAASSVKTSWRSNISTNHYLRPNVFFERQNNFLKLKIHNNFPEEVKYVRIERKDLWRFEKSYSTKEVNLLPWLNYHVLEKDLEFVDTLMSPNRAYSYRITSFDRNSVPVSVYLTPPMTLDDHASVFDVNEISSINGSPKFLDVNVSVVDVRQNPIYVKVGWKINLPWNTVKILYEDKSVFVDAGNTSAVLSGFEKNKTYQLSFELYAMDNSLTDVFSNVQINTNAKSI